MTKPMYDEDFRYTQTAMDIEEEIDKALVPIFKRYIAEGYSPRDISHVIGSIVSSLELEHVLDCRLQELKSTHPENNDGIEIDLCKWEEE